MLSAEELRLWDHVRSTKFDQPLAANQHVSRIRPLLEDDLVAIIATLHESTAAVEKQTDSFQRHRDDQLLDTSKRQPRTFERTKRDLIGPIRRKDALELQQLWFALGEEIGAFATSFQAALEDTLQNRKTTEGQLTQRLHDDDQELEALQKLVRPHVAVTHCKIDSDKKASQLVKRLADFICEETQCRLDRIYLEHLHGPVKHENGIKEGPTTQDISLKSDLDSLYAEIRDVVAMSVYREFESPLLKSRQEDQHRQSASEDLSNRFILRTLSKFRLSLEEAVDGLESLYSYRASLDAVLAVRQKIGAIVEHDLLFTPVAQEPPIKEAASRALLRSIGISNEIFTDGRSLELDLSNKVTKLRAPAFFSATSADESLRSFLEVNNASSQLLSRIASPALLDTSVGALDDKIAFLKGKVEDIDLSTVGSSTAQKHFLDKWA